VGEAQPQQQVTSARRDDRAAGIHRPFQSERPAVRLGRHGIRQQRLAGRSAQTTRDPRQHSTPEHDEPVARRRNHCGRKGHDGISAGSDELAAAQAIRQPAAVELRDARKAIGHTLYGAQCSGRRPHRGEKGGQQRGHGLVAGVGKKRGQADAQDRAVEPT